MHFGVLWLLCTRDCASQLRASGPCSSSLVACLFKHVSRWHNPRVAWQNLFLFYRKRMNSMS